MKANQIGEISNYSGPVCVLGYQEWAKRICSYSPDLVIDTDRALDETLKNIGKTYPRTTEEGMEEILC